MEVVGVNGWVGARGGRGDEVDRNARDLDLGGACLEEQVEVPEAAAQLGDRWGEAAHRAARAGGEREIGAGAAVGVVASAGLVGCSELAGAAAAGDLALVAGATWAGGVEVRLGPGHSD